MVGVAVDGQMVQAEQAVDVGVTEFEAADAVPVPTALVAATVKV